MLRKFADQGRLGQLEGAYATTEMWHETGAVKSGTIRRETSFPSDPTNGFFPVPMYPLVFPYSRLLGPSASRMATTICST